MNAYSSRQFGDFQTPLELASAICDRLKREGLEPSSVFEPTCGGGAFIVAALNTFGNELPISGIELQPGYHAGLAMIARRHKNVAVFQEDIFKAEVSSDVHGVKPNVLVLGNPPWVTNAELGTIGGANLPQKTNSRRLRGIDAVTGSSNFDIAEAIIYRLVFQLRSLRPTVALLCKTQVARNVLLENHRQGLGLSEIRVYKINAMKWFRVSVDACLLAFRVGIAQEEIAAIFNSLDDVEPNEHWFVKNQRLRKNGAHYERASHVEGTCQVEWRQGVKHDASTIMELVVDGNHFVNGLGETVEVEDTWLFPLLKSSDIANGRTEPRKAVLITQRHPGDDTSILKQNAPRLWRYLQRHRDVLEARGSSIYRGKSPFCIFGIGPYSFAPYKVAISGLYHATRFEILGPQGTKPVMLDDTCYFAPCKTQARAVALYVLVTSEDVITFMRSVTFSGSKRPITKKVLQRIDLMAVYEARSEAYWTERIRAVISSGEWSSAPNVANVMHEIIAIGSGDQTVLSVAG